MKVLLWLIAGLLMVIPALIVAIALGPVIVAVLCAVGFGLIVFLIVNFFIAIGTGIERTGSRLARRR
jgi:O-antigen/teichoic acid export membrane protein